MLHSAFNFKKSNRSNFIQKHLKHIPPGENPRDKALLTSKSKLGFVGY